MQIKHYIIKYLLIVTGIAILRVLLYEFFPEIFNEIINTEESIHSKTTFWGIYNSFLMNILLVIPLSFDLNRINRKWFLISVFTVISSTVGLFFFSLLILDHKLKKNE
jgi:hypothetical protein